MDVRLLGPVEVLLEDGPATLRRGRQRQLVGVLALRPSERVGLGQLTEALWPEGPPQDPANTVQQLVAQIRRALGAERDLLETVERGYRLRVAVGETDVGRAVEAHTRARRLADEGAIADARDAVAGALAQWRGSEIDGIEDGPLGIEAQRLVDLHADLHVLAADLAMRAGDLDGLADRLADACARHPLHEPLWERWIDAMARGGRPADALATYERLRRRLADDLGVDPSPQLRSLHERLLRDDEEPPPQRAVTSSSMMPAVTLTRFFGRAGERAQLDAWLTGGARLITVVGAGGVGKTRLVAEHLSEREPVVFVRLEQVGPDGDVAAAVAAELGLREIGTRPLADVIVDAMPTGATVVLDNAEHVTVPAAALATSLAGRRQDLTVLITSQQSLGVAGEHVLQLDPLPLPDGVDLESAGASPAVGLLLDRIAVVHPSVTPDEETVTAAVAIATALDGVPLAIELAAARATVMSPTQLAASLGDHLGLLEHPVPGRAPRHRRLSDAVGWSLGLLAPDERDALVRCGVFTGRFEASAAARLAGRDESETLSRLVALAERSLVQIEDGGDRAPRFRLLQPVRAQALREIATAGALQSLRDRLVDWAIDLVEQGDDEIRRHDQMAWMRKLDDARGDIDVAIEHALQTGRLKSAARVVAALGRYWDWRGRLRDQQRWTDAVIAASTDAHPRAAEDAGRTPRRLGAVLAWRAFVAIEHGDRAQAAATAARALTVSRSQEDADGETAALACQTTLLRGEGRFGDALRITEHAFTAAQRAGLPWAEAWAVNSRGYARVAIGDLDGAGRDADDSTRRFAALGDQRAVQWGRLLRALVDHRAGDLRAACATANDVMACAQRSGDLRTASVAYDLLAELADDDAEAARLHAIAADFRARRGQVPAIYADVPT